MFAFRKFNWRYALAGLIGFGGLFAGIWTLAGQRTSRYNNVSTAIPAVPKVEPEIADADFYDVNPTPDTIEQASFSVARAAHEAMIAMQWKGEATPGDPKPLVDQIQQAMEMYLTGSIESYEEYMASQGLPLPPGWEQNKERFAESFALTFETLRLAPLSTRNVVVRPRYVHGDLITYEDDTHTTVSTAYRPERLPRSGTEDRVLLEVYEVIVPAQVVDYEVDIDNSSLGKKVSSRARFGMWFKLDRSSHQWTLMKIVIYDNPRNTAVVMPPL